MLTIDIEKRLDQFDLSINFTVEDSAFALFGPSGAGKSMTLKCIAGIEKPDRGRIVLNDRVLYDSEKHINLSPQERCVGYLFQEYALFPNMTVRGNITAGLHRYPRRERAQRADRLMEQFHLTELADTRPERLSGGERQRVALARIFASSPEVLLLDEPFSSLDTMLKLELIPQLKHALNQFAGSCIMVSHDIGDVIAICKTVSVINKGQLGEMQDAALFYHKMMNQYKEAGFIPTA